MVINEKVLLSGQYFKKGYIRNISEGASDGISDDFC